MDQLKPTLANSCPLTPLNFLERAATVYGSRPSLVYNDTVYTWADTQTRCLKLSSSILALGINKNDVISVIAPNIPAMYELHFAIPMAGAVINTLNTRLDARTVSVLLRHSESKLVFVDYQYKHLLLEALSMFPKGEKSPRIVVISEDATSEYEFLVAKGDPGFRWVRPKSEWDPMTLNYTSGTTSAPKGVVHCHRSIFIMTVDSLIDWSVPKEPVFLWTLPMFHSNGWCFTWGMAAAGGTNVCMRRVDPPAVHAAIYQHGVTHMCGAPVVLSMLSAGAQQKLRRRVSFLTGGAPPPASVLLRTEAVGFEVTHGYGMTEAAGVVVSCAWKKEWDPLPDRERATLKARQGVRTNALTEVDVIDPVSGKRVNRDGSSQGEIALRGPSLMLGYLKDPEATKKCLRPDGWMYTGDVAVIHLDGYLEIKDRSKDVIISGGENVSSVEVESVIYSHPEVNEAAVVARPDEFWGETPCAFVTLKNGSGIRVTEREIIEFCRTKMPRYMVPKTVVFKSDLPKTSTGKIQKNLLRDAAKVLGKGEQLVARL